MGDNAILRKPVLVDVSEIARAVVAGETEGASRVRRHAALRRSEGIRDRQLRVAEIVVLVVVPDVVGVLPVHYAAFNLGAVVRGACAYVNGTPVRKARVLVGGRGAGLARIRRVCKRDVRQHLARHHHVRHCPALAEPLYERKLEVAVAVRVLPRLVDDSRPILVAAAAAGTVEYRGGNGRRRR